MCLGRAAIRQPRYSQDILRGMAVMLEQSDDFLSTLKSTSVSSLHDVQTKLQLNDSTKTHKLSSQSPWCFDCKVQVGSNLFWTLTPALAASLVSLSDLAQISHSVTWARLASEREHVAWGVRWQLALEGGRCSAF
eukprot:1101528-Amphidinium_carterae.1